MSFKGQQVHPPHRQSRQAKGSSAKNKNDSLLFARSLQSIYHTGLLLSNWVVMIKVNN
jgi:hypothetical protein